MGADAEPPAGPEHGIQADEAPSTLLVDTPPVSQDDDAGATGADHPPDPLVRPLPARTAGWRSWPSSDAALAVVMGLLAALPRLVTAKASFVIADEPRWMYRSNAFSEALTTGHPADASAVSFTDANDQATMPGVVTMWIGSAARGLWAVGRWLGVVPENEGRAEGFAYSTAGLQIAQVLVALATAALVALLVLLVARWAGRTAAAVTGVLLATEPFVVANGAILHTDELSSLLGIGSLVATALVLGLPHRTAWFGQRRVAALAGVLFGLSWLSKVSALMFLVSAALLFGWAYWRTRSVASGGADVRGNAMSAPPEARWDKAWLRQTVVRWAGSATIVMLACYPALWADPFSEVANLWTSATLMADKHDNFFLGETTRTPGPAFFLVALPFRMTVWFLVGTVAAIAVVAWRPRTRSYGVAALVMAGPALVIISGASKQFDRYGLPVLVTAAIVVGLAVEAQCRGRGEGRGWSRRRRFGIALGVVTLGLTAHSLVVAPWGLAYFNPMLGGSSTAEETLLVGLGEGLDDAFAIVEQHAPGCDDLEVRVQGWIYTPLFWTCDDVTEVRRDADYIVLYVAHNQRAEPGELSGLTEGRDLVGSVEIRGITYAEVFGPREESPEDAPLVSRPGG